MTKPLIQKKPACEIADWHWEDLMATLRKRGWSLRQIGIAEGYDDGNSLSSTKRRPFPKGEAILARYAGVEHPKLIWPSRYDAEGQPNRPKGPTVLRGVPPLREVTTAPRAGNPQARRAG